MKTINILILLLSGNLKCHRADATGDRRWWVYFSSVGSADSGAAGKSLIRALWALREKT